MGVLECASGASVWRGYEYYQGKKVRTISEITEHVFLAQVAGSAKEPYRVELHVDHPRKSNCNCPRANGKRVICKHLVAAYFAAFPKAAEAFYAEVMACQQEEERREEALADQLCAYVAHMKKAELEQALLQLLFDGPEWQYDRFIRENGLEDR